MCSAFCAAILACFRKEETVMKTDLVLTMDEYLAMSCDTPKHVNPPGNDARHIPITDGGDVGTKNEEQGCRCDRWGHPCPRCMEHEQLQCASVQNFGKRESR
jgi:hypothetical protein